jgi:Type VI secretion system/phage-baseplate injector OB domain
VASPVFLSEMITGAADGHANVILGMQIGTVYDNADPEGRYRVQIQIPGLVDVDEETQAQATTDWAPPLGTTGGGAARGGFVVPAIGSKVGVLFHNGDIDSPYYLCGPWYDGPNGLETPAPANGLGADTARVASLQIGSFQFSVDERPSQLIFTAQALDAKGNGISVELDFANQGITIFGTAAIILKTLGLIHLDALTVRLQDRLLATTSRPV